jgi:hypothetical protein
MWFPGDTEIDTGTATRATRDNAGMFKLLDELSGLSFSMFKQPSTYLILFCCKFAVFGNGMSFFFFRHFSDSNRLEQ